MVDIRVTMRNQNMDFDFTVLDDTLHMIVKWNGYYQEAYYKLKKLQMITDLDELICFGLDDMCFGDSLIEELWHTLYMVLGVQDTTIWRDLENKE